MADEILLNEAAYAVWQTVKERGPIELGEVVKLTGVDQAQVSAAVTEAARQGYFGIEEHEREELVRTDDARKLLQAGLPEIKAAIHLSKHGNKLPMQEFLAWANINDVPPNEVLKWGGARGWIEKTKTPDGVVIVLKDSAV
jgi:hypothetical protein